MWRREAFTDHVASENNYAVLFTKVLYGQQQMWRVEGVMFDIYDRGLCFDFFYFDLYYGLVQ